jgi:hypothetical protein
MTYAYPRGLRGPVVQDVMLAGGWFVALFLIDIPAVRFSLLVSIPLVLAWGAVTLHFPSRVDIDDQGVAFFHYARVHRFAWKDVTRVRVKKFLVKDRVLVRLEPSSPWRGRYWLVDSIEGFDALVAAFDARAKR